MSDKKIRIGFVGVGGMGQAAHLRHYVQVPECEVVALAEIKQDMAKNVAARWGVKKIYASHEDMLAKENPELAAGLPATEALVRRAIALDEGFGAGALYDFLIAYDGGRPASAGGSVERARAAPHRT